MIWRFAVSTQSQCKIMLINKIRIFHCNTVFKTELIKWLLFDASPWQQQDTPSYPPITEQLHGNNGWDTTSFMFSSNKQAFAYVNLLTHTIMVFLSHRGKAHRVCAEFFGAIHLCRVWRWMFGVNLMYFMHGSGATFGLLVDIFRWVGLIGILSKVQNN